MKYLYVALCLLLPALCFGQSSIFIRNSTWQEFDVEVTQYGTHAMAQNEWSVPDTIARIWLEDADEVFQVTRDTSTIPLGDTIYFDIALQGGIDTLSVKLRLIGVSGGSELDYSVAGAGFSEPWFDDGNFHEVQTNLAGKSVVIKFTPNNNDNNYSRDITFAIHDLPIYEINQADYDNPNILNVMAYNIQMLPFGVVGLPQASLRAELFPAQISPYQDVVIFAEVFDDSPREDELEPAMEAAGFPYKTTILNDPGGGLLPWNGGVMIFSRWPIEASDEYDFELCGPNAQDCLANKGIKYAKINKMGKRYHVFGTHMDAGSGQEDYDAKLSQIGEMRRFIAEQNIPDGEPAVFGGDFNIAPIDDDSLYFNFLDSLSPVIPHPIGLPESTFSDNFGNIIDHVWGDSRSLLPLHATNEVITPRSLHDDMWDLYEFSDHRCVLGRFVYPDITSNGKDTVLCPGEDLDLSITTNHAVTYQWLKNGVEIHGATSAVFSLQNVVESDSGRYECRVGYDVTYGDTAGPLIPLLYPYGVDNKQAVLTYDMGLIDVDSVLCKVGVVEHRQLAIEVYPNPNNGNFYVSIDPSVNLQDAIMEVCDVLGKPVLSRKMTSAKQIVNLGVLPKGVYVVSVYTADRAQRQCIILE